MEAERVRRAERISAAKANDVWEYRTAPPPEWSAPLNSMEQNSSDEKDLQNMAKDKETKS